MRITNATALVQWAVSTGRIDAADADEWIANLAGDGGEAYADLLLDGTARDQTIRPS